jgi:hypothetical protein
MNADLTIDAEALVREIARYLAAVNAFREAGCSPLWLPERRSWARRAWLSPAPLTTPR